MSTLAPSADRNLLFGLLALHMDFVTRDQLIEAMNAWLLDKHRSLGEVLRQRGVLDEDDRVDIERLVNKHIKRHGGDPQASLAAVRVEQEVRDSLAGLGDPEIQASLGPGTQPSDPSPAPPLVEGAGRKPIGIGSMRYRRLEGDPLGQGGLGIVYVALDDELERRVALKEIKTRECSRDDLARFVREAEITGKLEHPGVVPIYGLGAHADGRPFYAMRLIRGVSMHDAIDRFHQADREPRDPGERSLALRELLTRFVTVCNAVSFAHACGVVHRDLKPANVMLGDYGETLVIDWGLAKVVPRSNPDETTAEPQVSLHLGGDSAPTAMGGTLAYMPPEQAAGRMNEVGPAADVFALGAILYQTLTGGPPYRGVTKEELLQQARQAQIVPARRRNALVARPLEAACSKAMAFSPDDRYAGAKELADEVRRWLADEPVNADREPILERMRRWGRRHRTLATSTVAVLLASVVALGAGLWAVNAEKVNTGIERDRAVEAEKDAKTNLATAQANLNRALKAEKKERERATEAEKNLARALRAEGEATANLKQSQENLKLARKAIDDCYNAAEEHPLFQGARMEKARKLLMEMTLPFYKHFRAQRPDDLLLRSDEADQWFRVATIEHKLMRLEDARASYEVAIGLQGRLAEGHPTIPLLQHNLARMRVNLGLLLADRKQYEEALKQYEAARDIRLKLIKGPHGKPEYRHGLALTHNHLGTLMFRMGRPEEVAKQIREALGLLGNLVEEYPQTLLYKNELVAARLNMGNILWIQGKKEEAQGQFEKGRDLSRELVKAHQDVPEYQKNLGGACSNLGILLTELGQKDEALKAFTEGGTHLSALVAIHRDIPAYRQQLAALQLNLGNLLRALEKGEEARKQYEQARDHMRELVTSHPQVPAYRIALADIHNNLGVLRSDQGDTEAEMREYDRALDVLTGMVKDCGVLPTTNELANLQRNLEKRLRNVDPRKDGMRRLDQIRALFLKLVQLRPDVSNNRVNLAYVHGLIAALLSSSDKREEAVTHLVAAVNIRRQLAKHHGEEVAYQRSQAKSQGALGSLLFSLGNWEEALKQEGEARDTWQRLIEAHPDGLEYRIEFARTCFRRGLLLFRMNRLSASVTEFNCGMSQANQVRCLDPRDSVASALRLDGLRLRATVLAFLGRRSEADLDWDAALALAPVAERPGLRFLRAEIRSRTGDYLRGASEARDLARQKGVAAGTIYDLARFQALNAAYAVKDPARPLPEREKRAEGYASEALALLKKAADAGWFNDARQVRHLDSNEDLAALREREDYRAFRKALEPAKR